MSKTLNTTDIVVIAIGLAILLLWFFLYFRGRKYWKLFANLDNEDYPLSEL